MANGYLTLKLMEARQRVVSTVTVINANSYTLVVGQ
jgi:hypothetical protein